MTIIIDAVLVHRLVAEQFPDLAHLSISPVVPGGWDNRTFRLGENMLVRLPSAGRYVAQVAKEHRWLPALTPHLPLPIPVPVANGQPGQGYPWPWSIYRWLPGNPVAREPQADLNRVACSLADFLSALHRIDTRDGPPPGDHNFHRGGQLAVYAGEVQAALAVLGETAETGVLRDVWANALASQWERPPVWVHGDVSGGNLLVRDGDLSAVIDFGSSAVGDPACDLVIAWTLFSGDSRATFRAALSLDDKTWSRARGWALWKALITVTAPDIARDGAEASWRLIGDVSADHRQCHQT
ncbi:MULTISPECIES: aminoglycoside phosphotransferase family protein [unclassified Chelatococcus]|uniref:aminoglycoside phosphotransferase family protein n=1 Tax=unclassified Chelatococcus TaxID=2638111 RepID=UPI001BD0C315|nr:MULTISPECIES: aminoglycoside phosphotransferase family protein [unclassified Chelatococcus]CAH1658196.1 Aminoglycoside phosphotransferase (APT) family kinase protein [Hyphomicrobiales bacterium]MBS7740777.1 aminoglycoside phosphotransferase family protein [Chelatococcus sp. HY11]MBX3545989.1 aminoglycoside phosphotransferase family protein [Chelatococcus sp.]MCO5079616.1 aminoglycoside phosphotransferase family protein [Chelatococcus sp.]CAH1684212.1 Aminoglycoside phosphotransferase (APT) 